MESFFATLKKEKLYQINTECYPMVYTKSIIFRYIMVYYNRQRVYTLLDASSRQLYSFVLR
ncbi:IS3 family transposase [Paenibacillus vini]